MVYNKKHREHSKNGTSVSLQLTTSICMVILLTLTMYFYNWSTSFFNVFNCLKYNYRFQEFR